MVVSLGIEDADGGDPRELVPAQALDARICPPLDKSRVEEVQVLAFLQTVALFTGGLLPYELKGGEDPPDRRLTDSSGTEWALELTRLTLGNVRSAVSRARQLGRLIESKLRHDGRAYSHLLGRRVVLSLVDAGALDRDSGLADAIATDLRENRGFVKERGFVEHPDQLLADGHYQQRGPVLTSVNELGNAGEYLVLASAQAELRQSEILQALARLVDEKDRVENELLLITAAGPDEWGYVCQPDNVLFGLVARAAESRVDLKLTPSYLSGILPASLEHALLAPSVRATWHASALVVVLRASRYHPVDPAPC